jgi:hypothetical protein
MQQTESLDPNLGVPVADPGDVAAWPIDAGNETDLHRVSRRTEHDWNARCRRFGRERGYVAAWRGDHGYLAADQIGRQFRQPVLFIARLAELECHVAAFDVADLAQPFAERSHELFHLFA